MLPEVEEEARDLVAARLRLRPEQEVLEVHVDVEQQEEDGDAGSVAAARLRSARLRHLRRGLRPKEDALDVAERALDERVEQLRAVWLKDALDEPGQARQSSPLRPEEAVTDACVWAGHCRRRALRLQRSVVFFRRLSRALHSHCDKVRVGCLRREPQRLPARRARHQRERERAGAGV